MSRSDVFRGLEPNIEGSFPRRCRKCGRSFDNLEVLWYATSAPASVSAIREAHDLGRAPFVEVTRVCHCGSRIIQPCDDRRNSAIHREQFAHLCEVLLEHGYDLREAEEELRNVLRGLGSIRIDELIGRAPPLRPAPKCAPKPAPAPTPPRRPNLHPLRPLPASLRPRTRAE